uniref:DUF305 domain-containing protein n=1 Tax=Roseihalotalea indica TaxID=2867963 RepID=A0AA49JH80_9BACT|nr:DUF305 domain-containing protein [Tunicatimonas sp. TK19036]
MNKQFLVLFFLSTVGMIACGDEEEGLIVQSHDDNIMMNIMHAMMNKMDSMERTGDPDHDFAMMMKMHHQGAINMAQEELNSGDDGQMRTIAQQVIDAQQAEIAIIDNFLINHQPSGVISEQFERESMMAMEKMMKANDLRVLSGDSDQDFASLMVDHHQSAIDNSQSFLNFGQTQAMRSLAMKIAEDQQGEIIELQNWLLVNKSY